ARVVDVLRLDVRAPEHEVLAAASDLMKARDAATDRERVEVLLDAYRSGGLGVAGLDETALALERGQVDELLITGAPQSMDISADEASSGARSADRVAGDLITKARRTAARVTVIQDASL